MSYHTLRRHLSIEGFLDGVLSVFKQVPDPVNNRGFTLADCLMSGLAMFHLKASSLLHFDRITRSDKAEDEVVHNLRTLYKVGKAPSDTTMRERLDPVDPASFRGVFTKVFSILQRGGALFNQQYGLFLNRY